MKKLFVFLLILIFVLFSYADFNFEITQKFKRGEAEITVSGKTLDKVWTGITQTLVRLKCRIIEEDKDTGFIEAWKISIGEVYLSKDEYSEPITVKVIDDEWKIMVEAVGEKIVIVCSYEGHGSGMLSSKKRSFKIFSQKLESILRR